MNYEKQTTQTMQTGKERVKYLSPHKRNLFKNDGSQAGAGDKIMENTYRPTNKKIQTVKSDLINHLLRNIPTKASAKNLIFTAKNRLSFTWLCLIIFLAASLAAFAQSSAPTARTPGAPAGSYKLDGFDTVNLFSGNLNFNLPFLSSAGRGDANQNLSLTIESQWDAQFVEQPDGNYRVNLKNYSPLPLSAIGSLRFENNITQLPDTCTEYPTYFINHQAYLVYTEPDGTEHTLVDPTYHGRPITLCGETTVNYGRVFESSDNSFITYVADADLGVAGNSLSGYLMFKNGTKLRVESVGLAPWTAQIVSSEDRNGNRTEYTYNTQSSKLTKIKDSLGREINLEYGVTESAPYGLCDKITYKGFAGSDKIIRISRKSLSDSLRTTQSYDSATPKTINEIFNEDPNDNLIIDSDVAYNPQVTSALWLPDGRSYQFKYDVYGYLARVELPTGGAMEYDFAPPTFDFPNSEHVNNRVKEKRSYTGTSLVGKTTFTKLASPPANSFPANRGGTAVDVEQFDPNGSRLSKSRHFFYGAANAVFGFVAAWWNGKEFKTENYDADGTTLLRKMEMDWRQRIPSWCYASLPGNNAPCGAFVPQALNVQETAQTINPFVAETKETLADGNLVTKTSGINPSDGSLAFDSYNNQTDVWSYDYGIGAPGAFLRRSHTDYVTDYNYTSRTGAHIRSLPTQTWRSSDEAGNNKVSLSQIEYDNYANDTNHASLVNRTNVSGHNTTNFGTGNPWRGNVTAVTSFANAAAQTDPVTTYSQYDILGNVVKTIDAKGNASTINYDDNFGSPDAEARTNSAPSQLNGQSAFAFAKSSTNALGWVTGYLQVDYFTGAGVDAEDMNGVVSSSFYNDLLDRPTQSIVANNLTNYKQQTSIVYDDTNRKITTTSDLNTFGDNSIKSESFYDGLGRATESRKYEGGGGYVATVIEYNALGRVKRVTSPYRPQQSEPQLWTTSQYDALGRVTSVTTPDNAVVQTAYAGNAVTVIDQAGKQRRSITNAIGQLTRVDEPDNSNNLGSISSPNQSTSYAYDTLNNLTTVNQGVQTRTFSYDSLSRLKQAINPESGTISYTYDANSNLTSKTDARNISTTYAYDNLNRITQRIYSDGTPQVTYTYDDPGIQFSKGRLTKVSSNVSETKYNSFDNLGKILSSQQITNGQTYGFGYQYNLGGMLTEETYPSGRKVKNTIDTDASLSKVETMPLNGSYATRAENFSYTAAGAVSAMKLGNNKWENAQFNSRLQPVQLGLGTSATDQSLWKINYDYATNTNGTDNNGNVRKQTITVPGISPLVQTYTYDTLNRINSAQETQNNSQTWKQTFGYDRYGNRNFDNTQTTTLGNCPAAQCNPAIDQSNNRFTTAQGYTYDLSGNLITDAQNRSFTYDAENKQKEVKDASNNSIGTYFYDGDGKRLKKVSAAETTVFVYDASGKLAAEYLLTSATPQTPTTSYLTTDTLGSPRVITDQSGNIQSRRDFMPFGEEIANLGNRTAAIGYQTDSTRQKFTGYERDKESSLDFAEARYHNFNLGRFNSPDPENAGAYKSDPQSWNGYTYAGNNPILFTDPTGEDYVLCDPDGKNCQKPNTDKQFENARKAGGFRFEEGKIYDSDNTLRGTYKYVLRGNELGQDGSRSGGLGIIGIAGVGGAIVGTGGVAAGGGATTGILGATGGSVLGGSSSGAGGAGRSAPTGFSPEEEAIAAWLRHLGRHVIHNPAEGQPGMGRQGDAIVDGKKVEFKTPNSNATGKTIKNEIGNSIRGVGQAREIVIDLRNTSITQSDAMRGAADGMKYSRGKLDAVTLIFRIAGSDFGVTVLKR